jgi:hypothetical protein
MGLAEADGISTIQKVPAFCTSIMKEAFLHENHLEIVSVDGPASKRSTTVVVHYRVRGKNGLGQGDKGIDLSETAAQRAQRLTAKLRGLMKDEITAHGGAEGFLRWVRSDEDEV